MAWDKQFPGQLTYSQRERPHERRVTHEREEDEDERSARSLHKQEKRRDDRL